MAAISNSLQNQHTGSTKVSNLGRCSSARDSDGHSETPKSGLGARSASARYPSCHVRYEDEVRITSDVGVPDVLKTIILAPPLSQNTRYKSSPAHNITMVNTHATFHTSHAHWPKTAIKANWPGAGAQIRRSTEVVTPGISYTPSATSRQTSSPATTSHPALHEPKSRLGDPSGPPRFGPTTSRARCSRSSIASGRYARYV